MSHRFFLDPAVSTLNGEQAVLNGDEAHHFCRVMRGGVGDEIILFDGSGFSYRCRVESVSKTKVTKVTARILETLPDKIESPLRLTVATALPKGDRQRFLVEKLAELGVARFVPVHLERSVARSDAAVAQRLRRYVIETAKQCGRNVLMELENEMSLHELNRFLTTPNKIAPLQDKVPEWQDKVAEWQGNVAKFLLHPVSLGAVGQTTLRPLLAGELPKQIVVLIGPEGSFTDQEVETALSFGFQPLDLGARILRTETACIAVASCFLVAGS
jgi:16S rRNA (uracil1498-N3)-methyltransferase